MKVSVFSGDFLIHKRILLKTSKKKVTLVVLLDKHYSCQNLDLSEREKDREVHTYM